MRYLKKYDQLLIDHCADGGDFMSFCGRYKIPEAVFAEWANTSESFNEACGIAELASYAWWEKLNRLVCYQDKTSTLIEANMKQRFNWKTRAGEKTEGKRSLESVAERKRLLADPLAKKADRTKAQVIDAHEINIDVD